MLMQVIPQTLNSGDLQNTRSRESISQVAHPNPRQYHLLPRPPPELVHCMRDKEQCQCCTRIRVLL